MVSSAVTRTRNMRAENLAVRIRFDGGEESRVGEDSDETGRADRPYRLPTIFAPSCEEIILESTK